MRRRRGATQPLRWFLLGSWPCAGRSKEDQGSQPACALGAQQVGQIGKSTAASTGTTPSSVANATPGSVAVARSTKTRLSWPRRLWVPPQKAAGRVLAAHEAVVCWLGQLLPSALRMPGDSATSEVPALVRRPDEMRALLRNLPCAAIGCPSPLRRFIDMVVGYEAHLMIGTAARTAC